MSFNPKILTFMQCFVEILKVKFLVEFNKALTDPSQ